MLLEILNKWNENSKNLLSRFISFIDVLYENKNILSISTNVELDKLNIGKTNSMNLKEQYQDLKKWGSSDYINKYLKKLLKKSMKNLKSKILKY